MEDELKPKKNLDHFLDLCVLSLHRGHVSLLRIISILSDVPKNLAADCTIYKRSKTMLSDAVGLLATLSPFSKHFFIMSSFVFFFP